MTPDAYCRRLADPPGADFHYSLLGLTQAQRQALIALQAFNLEITRIAEDCRDPGVARDKLGWWQAEVGRLFASDPQHPVTRALQPQLAAFNLPEEYFREMLDGAAMDLEYDVYPGFSELTLYLHRLGSTPALLAAEVLGYQDRRGTPRFAHEAGSALLLFDRLHEVRRYAQHGRFYFPEDEMHRFGVGPGDLLAAQTADRVQQLFAFQADRIRDYHHRALEQLPVVDCYAQSSVLIRLELAMTLLAEIKADGYRLLEQRISLTPLRKLWLAWRLRRRERRRAAKPPVVSP